MQTLLIVPIMLHYLWNNTTPSPHHFNRRFRVVVYGVLHIIKHHSTYILAFFLVLMMAIFGLPMIEANTDYVRFFKESNVLRADYQKIEESKYAQSYVNVVLTFPENSDYASRENFVATLRFEQAIEALPEVRKINTVTHLLREVDKAFNGSEASEMAFREYGANQVSQLLLLAEASGNNDVTELITGERQQVQLVVMTDYMSTKELNHFRQRLKDIQAQTLPVEVKMSITGTNVLWSNMDDRLVHTQLLSLIITSVVILILLPIIFRSLVLGLFGFFVSFLPILFTLGLMAWVGVTINIATCIIGGVVIGIAVDDTIYFLFRMRGEMKQGFSLSYAIKRAIWITGKGMIITSLILMGGFLTMTASDFLPSAYFGLFFAISICIALLADLFLLPVILYWVYGKGLKSL
ncbi:membrane protein containing MMPL domain protein [Candidatus Thiomargarita nelsonii]|uniref:Membrane protein containing MMPL domain protein n=1 Tax=Candidatus Thiomargarita nelsonii TaxID=1003181 RepID=A0A176S757_9GAMM|nr:membrane protein containing MMPL domain protein [Candidatus Thiomargarita nelsonii]